MLRGSLAGAAVQHELDARYVVIVPLRRSCACGHHRQTRRPAPAPAGPWSAPSRASRVAGPHQSQAHHLSALGPRIINTPVLGAGCCPGCWVLLWVAVVAPGVMVRPSRAPAPPPPGPPAGSRRDPASAHQRPLPAAGRAHPAAATAPGTWLPASPRKLRSRLYHIRCRIPGTDGLFLRTFFAYSTPPQIGRYQTAKWSLSVQSQPRRPECAHVRDVYPFVVR